MPSAVVIRCPPGATGGPRCPAPPRVAVGADLPDADGRAAELVRELSVSPSDQVRHHEGDRGRSGGDEDRDRGSGRRVGVGEGRLGDDAAPWVEVALDFGNPSHEQLRRLEFAPRFAQRGAFEAGDFPPGGAEALEDLEPSGRGETRPPPAAVARRCGRRGSGRRSGRRPSASRNPDEARSARAGSISRPVRSGTTGSALRAASRNVTAAAATMVAASANPVRRNRRPREIFPCGGAGAPRERTPPGARWPMTSWGGARRGSGSRIFDWRMARPGPGEFRSLLVLDPMFRGWVLPPQQQGVVTVRTVGFGSQAQRLVGPVSERSGPGIASPSATGVIPGSSSRNADTT